MCPLQALSLLSPIRYACFLYSIQNESLISGTLFSAVTLQPITDLRAKLLNQTTMLWNAKAMTGADMRKHSPVSSKRTLFGGGFQLWSAGEWDQLFLIFCFSNSYLWVSVRGFAPGLPLNKLSRSNVWPWLCILEYRFLFNYSFSFFDHLISKPTLS